MFFRLPGRPTGLALAALLAACANESSSLPDGSSPPADSGPRRDAMVDAGLRVDAGFFVDAGFADAAALDGSVPDADLDSGFHPDASTSQDSGELDAGNADSGDDDAGTGDAAADSGVPDGGLGCGPLGGTTTGTASLNGGLIARYCFDDPMAPGRECSGQGPDLAASNSVVSAIDGFDSAVSLNGTDGYLETTSAVFSPQSSDWTVAAWVRVSTAATSRGAIVSWYRCGVNPSCTSADSATYELSASPAGGFLYVRDDYRSDLGLRTVGTGTVSDGCWHHLAATIDRGSEVTNLYLDGALVATSSVALGSLSAGPFSVPFEIGRHYIQGWGVPNTYFEGRIDEVRVYGRALSPSEVDLLRRATP